MERCPTALAALALRPAADGAQPLDPNQTADGDEQPVRGEAAPAGEVGGFDPRLRCQSRAARQLGVPPGRAKDLAAASYAVYLGCAPAGTR